MWASLGLNVALIWISYQTWLSINPSYYNYLSRSLLYLLGLVNLPVCAHLYLNKKHLLNLQFQKIFVVHHGAVCSQYYIAATYSVVGYTDKPCKTSDSGPKETLASKPASMQEGFKCIYVVYLSLVCATMSWNNQRSEAVTVIQQIAFVRKPLRF